MTRPNFAQQAERISELTEDLALTLQAAIERALDDAYAAGVRTFARAVLHGDDRHRAWLTEAAEAFVMGKPLPPPSP